MKIINLYFPQWQGAATNRYLHNSPLYLRNRLKQIEFLEVEINNTKHDKEKNNIKYYDDILDHLNRVKKILGTPRPAKIFTIGGDCGVELGPISYLNNLYNGDLAVLWFDAHGDLNTPKTSSSKHFHGMPLRTLLGEGDENIIRKLFSTIKPEQVILIGTRDLDNPEIEYIKHKKIFSISDEDLANKKVDLCGVINERFYKNIYMHVDVDVLNPDIFPYSICPTKGGISPDLVRNILIRLKDKFNLVGLSIVEYNSQDGAGSKIAQDFYVF